MSAFYLNDKKAGAGMAAGQEKEAGKRKALGRGLESLLPRSVRIVEVAAETLAPQAVTDHKALELALDQIDPNPYQTRTVIDERGLAELAASIRESGVIQPILVRPGTEGRYQLIAGQRRLLASKMAGKMTIPTVVAVLNDAQALEATIIENLQRADLTPMEQARALDRLSREFQMTQEQMAIRTGKDRATISNFLRLLRLPEDLQQKVTDGYMTFGHARAVLSLDTHDQMRKAAQRIMALSMSVRQTETFVRGIIDPQSRLPAKPKEARVVDPNVRELENRLREALGMRVEIEDIRGRGRLTIEYGDLNGFEMLMERLVGS
jgi:ParB family chromosome partitioning protein